MEGALGKIAREVKSRVGLYRLILRDPETPLVAKMLLGAAIGYVLMPFDLIPDFLPVIGHLDDLVIVPLLIYLAMRLIPAEVVERSKRRLAGG